MNGKEKFIFAILIALVGGAFYFQIMTDELNLRMDELDLADKSHVDKVLNEFSDSLRVYNLRFNGRGKHLRSAQKDILSNADLIEKNTDSLATMIDDVGFRLDNFQRKTEKNFRNLNSDLDDLATEMKGTLRKIKLNISDIEQTSTRLDQRIKELEDLGIIQKAIAKEAEGK